MIAIRTEELGKAYRVYARPVDSFKEWLLRRDFHETFWALRDFTVSVPRGAALGVIGENGAGKSTLLKLLAGTIAPSHGRLERNGRISAILELGSGFHPELSGRENVRIGCAVLGLSPDETERRLPEIIAFSELEDFIDRPVKIYSSGMYVRLAFSIVTSVDPDVLIVDEALAVGDEHFQKKSIDRILSFRKQGKTLVFCSHVMYHVKELCDQCVWLDRGRPELFGPAMKVTQTYEDYERGRDGARKSDKRRQTETAAVDPDGETRLTEVTVGGDVEDGVIATGGTLTVRAVAHLAPAAVGDAHLGVLIQRNDMEYCYGVSTEIDGTTLHSMGGSAYGTTFVIESLPLLAGKYAVNVALLDGSALHVYEYREGAATFLVRHGTKEVGMARIGHRWERP